MFLRGVRWPKPEASLDSLTQELLAARKRAKKAHTRSVWAPKIGFCVWALFMSSLFGLKIGCTSQKSLASNFSVLVML